jgi:hypothetical protein
MTPIFSSTSSISSLSSLSSRLLLLSSTLLLLSSSLLAQPADTIRQHWHRGDAVEPTKKDVLLQLVIVDFAKKRVPDLDVRLLQTSTGQVWQGVTGKYGEVYFLVPRAQEFRIDAGTETGLLTFKSVDEAYTRDMLTVTHLAENFTERVSNDTIYQTVSLGQTPSRDRVLTRIRILDLDDKPLEGELLYFTAEKAGKVFVTHTDRSGRANLMLRKGDSYCFSMAFYPKLKCYEVEQNDLAGTLTITFNTIGTKALQKRKEERERLAAIRDSLLEVARVRDSIANQYRGSLEENFVDQLSGNEPMDSVKLRVARRADKERKAVQTDPQYFEKSGEVVKAALYRMRDRWSHKVIVTDQTGSMYPYVDQVTVWHALQLAQGEDNQYIFFNDGDAKSSAEKVIGQTGGIYYTGADSLAQLLRTMLAVSKAGGGGESEENDLEALLAGARKMQGTDELILIADNYSDVRDMELLSRLKVPVRIILCGTEHGVNENYLEIAYKTGGSIHTIEDDIENLKQLSEGSTVQIGRFQYRISHGKFIQVKKL